MIKNPRKLIFSVNLPCQFSIMQVFAAFWMIKIDQMAAILKKILFVQYLPLNIIWKVVAALNVNILVRIVQF